MSASYDFESGCLIGACVALAAASVGFFGFMLYVMWVALSPWATLAVVFPLIVGVANVVIQRVRRRRGSA